MDTVGHFPPHATGCEVCGRALINTDGKPCDINGNAR
jgi:hypothetical protein